MSPIVEIVASSVARPYQPKPSATPAPIRHDTEVDIRAAEKRYDEDAKRIEAAATEEAATEEAVTAEGLPPSSFM